jgi:hypothetical protein
MNNQQPVPRPAQPVTRVEGTGGKNGARDLTPQTGTASPEDALREVDHILGSFTDLTEIAQAGRHRRRSFQFARSADIVRMSQSSICVAEQRRDDRDLWWRGLCQGHRALLIRPCRTSWKTAHPLRAEGTAITVQTRQAERACRGRWRSRRRVSPADRERSGTVRDASYPSRSDGSNVWGSRW